MSSVDGTYLFRYVLSTGVVIVFALGLGVPLG